MQYGSFQSITTPDNKLAFVLSNGVTLIQTRPAGDSIELIADRAVVFTPRSGLRAMADAKKYDSPESAIESVFLEGDVRITFTPAPPQKPGEKPKGEQRLRGNRVYYDFTTDRAVLTDAVVHTIDPQINIPMVVRGSSSGRCRSASIRRRRPSYRAANLPRLPTASAPIARTFGRSIPVIRGSASRRCSLPTMQSFAPTEYPIFTCRRWREISRSVARHCDRFTPNPTAASAPACAATGDCSRPSGILPPEDLDMSFHLDYLSDRGFGTGIDGGVSGRVHRRNNQRALGFSRQVHQLHRSLRPRCGQARRRPPTVTPERETRGKVLWEHQHFFPDDWQAQLRLGYVSDPTFLEEWYQNEFDTTLPYDASIYLKHQKDTEAFTFLTEVPTRDFVTTADQLQENTQVERFPELGYRRIGDSFGDDQFTFYSENSVAALRFNPARTTLAELGFRKGESPGIPSYGETGVNDSTNFRGDTRQEVDYPVQLGHSKSCRSSSGGTRVTPTRRMEMISSVSFAGTGVRINTAFWRTDDSAYSQLLDINRIRHIIEPEINLFTSGSTVHRDHVYDYEEDVDKVNDVTGVNSRCIRRGRQNAAGDGIVSQRGLADLKRGSQLLHASTERCAAESAQLRGLFFPSEPELSVPRNSINSDALYRISDTTALLADEEYNLDTNSLATTSIGFAVQREDRLAYFLGLRYIGELNSTVASVSTSYQLSLRYNLSLNESIDLGTRRSENSSFTLTRHFDRFFASLTLYYDQIDKQSGFRFGFVPEGLGRGVSSDQVGNSLGAR